MNLSWLTTLRTVARSKSYTKASEALFISQSAVSQQIRQLERFFGAKLVDRTGQDFHFTDSGTLVLELACRIEDDLEETRRKVRELTSGNQSLVTIASAPSPLLHFMPHVLSLFWAEHPEVDVKTIVRFGPEITAAVKNGTADLGLHSSAYTDPMLATTPMGLGRIIAVASPQHALAGQSALQPDMVTSHRVAITSPGTSTRALVDGWFAARGSNLNRVIEVSSHEEIRMAVIENLALGFLGFEAVRDDLAAERLVELDIEGFDLSSLTCVSYQKGIQGPAAWLVDQILSYRAAIDTADAALPERGHEGTSSQAPVAATQHP